MKRIIVTSILLLGFCLPSLALAQGGQKVAVAPYSMAAQMAGGAAAKGGAQLEQLSRISQGLMSVTVQGLSSQGFTPISLNESALAGGEDAAKSQARDLGADYLFFGSVTRVDNRFSLTGNLIALSPGGRSSDRVTITSNTLENLPQTAERLVLMTTDHLFGGGARVASVDIVGSSIVDKQAILNSLRIRPGGTYNDAKATSDLKRIHSMGYFEDVRVETSDVSGGKAVRFIVQERSQLGAIKFTGNKKFDSDDLMEQIGVKPYDIPSEAALSQSVEKLKKFYADKGFPQVQVSTEISPGDDGKSVLTYHIDEGGRIYVKKIEFDGNEFYSDWTLSRQIDSSTRGFLSWITGAGKLDREKLSGDSQKLEAYYQNHGFLQARVGEPQVDYDESGGMAVTFPIFEGPRYKVGNISIGGSLLPDDDPEKLLKDVDLRKETWFNREMLQEDIKRLKTHYSDLGYAHNQVEPEVGEPDADNRLDVELRVNPQNQVWFDRITIVGNEKTRDKVVRRQLAVAEGDLFSASKIQASQANLMRSSYFDEVNLVPGPSDADDKMNLRVEVKERPTGSFQIGAGYSSYNSIFGVARITQDNLFGYGRRLSLEANVGSKSNYYNLSYTDPWVADIPLTLGLDAFNYYTKYDYYKKKSNGLAFRAGYPVFESFYLTARYAWENIDITDVSDYSSQSLQSMRGTSVDSTWTFSLRRDTRNHFFYPTSGSTMRLTYGLGSHFLGGDTDFSRYEAEGAFWLPAPVWKGAAFMAHGQIGYEKENSSGGLPTYEKYMIGGINSVRGYDWYDISPRDPKTDEPIGGEKMMVFNFEFTFPLLKDEGLYAVAFYDMGNVWTKKQSYGFDDMKRSYGGGLRYLSPLGPFRIEYGRALDREEGMPSGRWEFTMGAMF